MRTHTQGFKDQIKELGREIDSRITYGDNTILAEQLFNINPIINGNILKSAMKELCFESSVKVSQYTVVKYEFGLKVNGEYEYLDYGNYIVNAIEYNEDTKTYKHTCYDSMLFLMKEYTSLQNGTFPMTVRQYISNLCLDCGLVFKNINDTFANYDKVIESDLYANLGYTYRDILDELSQVTASTICVNNNDLVEIRYINDTNDTIDAEYLKNINVTFGKKYGPINSIVLSRSAESDNVYLQDEDSVEANGLCELKIIDNQIMNDNNRSDYLPDILSKLNGLEYYLNDYTSTGILYYELCDKYTVQIEDNTYSCIMFNDEPEITQGIVENIFTEMPEETEIDYKKADKTDRKINQAYLIVDKQLGEIRGEVTKVETTVKDITTTTQTSTGGNSLHITDSLESNALEYHVDGKSEQETSVQQDGDNIFDFQQWYKKISNGIMTPTYNRGTFTLNENGFSVGQPSGKDCWIQTSGLVNGVSTGWGYTGNPDTEARKTVASYYTIPAEASTTYTLSCDITFEKVLSGEEIKSELYIFAYDTDFNYLGLVSKGIYDTFEANVSKRFFINRTLPQNTKYIFWRVDNESYYTDTPSKMTVSNIAIKKGTDNTYTEFIPNSPSPDYPSEIKTIPSIRNLLNNQDYTIGNIDGTNGNDITSTTTYRFNAYHECKENTKIYLSKELCIYYYDENKKYISCDVNGGLTKTTPVNTKYVRFRTFSRDFDTFNNNDYMVSYTPVKSYVPYGAWAKVKITGNNLINLGNSTITQNGITSILNNSSFIVNGTTEKGNTIFLKSLGVVKAGTYTIQSILESGSFTVPDNYTFGTYIRDDTKSLVTITNKSFENTKTFTINEDKELFYQLYTNGAEINFNNCNVLVQLEEGTATDYEAYKEKEVLIDLSKPNLFDNSLFVQGTPYDSTQTTRTSAFMKKVVSGETFTIKSNNSNLVFAIGFSDSNVQGNTTGINESGWVTDNQYTITSAKEGYLWINIRYSDNSIIKPTDIKASDFILYEGYGEYHELSSIGDTKDTLDIVNGQVVIDKKIDKVVLDGSTEIIIYSTASSGNGFYVKVNGIFYGGSSSVKRGTLLSNMFLEKTRNEIYLGNEGIAYNYDSGYLIIYNTETSNMTTTEFKTWLSENPVTVYYELAESKQIILPNTNIPLFEGVNHISLVEDLETTTSIKFLRQTPISGEYATNQQLGETNYNLANTTSQSNENTANINATNTNLNNNYYTKPQIDIMNTATTEEITTIKKEVETKITAEDLTIAINQIKTTGATSVETTTGYKFNEEGLSIQKSGSEMSSLLDNDGLVVKRSETEMLTVRSSGVEAENITVRTYFTIGDNTRAENYKGGTGFFYIGGDD